MVDLIHEETFLGTIKDSVLDLTRDCLSGSHENTKKRKASVHGAEILNATKKTRSDVRGQSGSKPLRKDWSLIPKEYWQHIFTFVPPQTLGVVLQVNKYFNTYLVEDSSWTRFVSAADVRLEPLRPDEIWRASRKAHYHKLPGPLRGRTELEMWRLLRSSTCQFCGKVAQRNAPARYEKSSSRPGSEGVEVIWAFAIKSCGPCLIASSTKV